MGRGRLSWSCFLQDNVFITLVVSVQFQVCLATAAVAICSLSALLEVGNFHLGHM